MEKLISAASDFFAAIFARFGFVGRPRRRTEIQRDLDLLERLRDLPEFGDESAAHAFLTNKVTIEVARLAGVQFKQPIQKGSVVLAFFIGTPFAYWAYWLSQDGFSWWSLIPGAVAAMMAMSIVGLIFFRDGPEEEAGGSGASHGSGESDSPTQASST